MGLSHASARLACGNTVVSGVDAITDLQFAEEETEAERHHITHLRPHGSEVAEQGLGLGHSGSSISAKKSTHPGG